MKVSFISRIPMPRAIGYRGRRFPRTPEPEEPHPITVPPEPEKIQPKLQPLKFFPEASIAKSVWDITDIQVLDVREDGSVVFWEMDEHKRYPAADIILEISQKLALFYLDKSDFQNPDCLEKDVPVAVHLHEPADDIRYSQIEALTRMTNGACPLAHPRWVRGEITTLDETTKRVHVRLVDFGFVVEVDRKQIVQLDTCFGQPPQVLSAKIDGLDKIGLMEATRSRMETLLTLTPLDCQVSARIAQLKPALPLLLLVNNFDLPLLLRKMEKEEMGVKVQVGSILFVERGDNFAMLPSQNMKDLQRIQEDVDREACLKKKPSLSKHAMNATLLDDGNYYRGIICSKGDIECEVFLMDYRNRLTRRKHQLRGLSHDLAIIPYPTDICALSKIPYGQENAAKIVGWLRKFVHKDGTGEKQCLYRITQTNTAGAKEVELWDDQDRLVSGEYLLSRVLSSEEENEEPQFLKPEQKEKPLRLIDDEKLPRLQRGYQMKLGDLVFPKRYNEGDLLPVYVCHMIDPEYVFFVHTDEPLDVMYKRMERELRKHIDDLPRFRELPEIDVIICARYSVDLRWYRATILKHEGQTKAHVFFVDYGNYEVVQIEDMRPITESLSRYPKMGIPGVIDGIQAPPGGFTKSSVKKAETLVLYKSALLRIIQIIDDNVIGDMFLLDEKTGKRQSVAELYFKEAIAAPK